MKGCTSLDGSKSNKGTNDSHTNGMKRIRIIVTSKDILIDFS
jgi:hypothetical protein